MLECAARGGKRGLFVVKPLGFPDVTPGTCFRETFGTLLARTLGVTVPDPAIVKIDSAFVKSMERMESLGKRRMKEGICFGSRFLGRGYHAPTFDTRYDTNELIDSAVRIYAFDLTFQNCDRQPANPNCLIKDGYVYAYDFERAFEFTGWRKGAEKIPPCWPNKMWNARSHIFFPIASKKHDPLNKFIDDIRDLDASSIENAISKSPSQWASQIRQIAGHVQQIQNDLPTFRRNLLAAATRS